jgi:hypothetical protein
MQELDKLGIRLEIEYIKTQIGCELQFWKETWADYGMSPHIVGLIEYSLRSL